MTLSGFHRCPGHGAGAIIYEAWSRERRSGRAPISDLLAPIFRFCAAKRCVMRVRLAISFNTGLPREKSWTHLTHLDTGVVLPNKVERSFQSHDSAAQPSSVSSVSARSAGSQPIKRMRREQSAKGLRETNQGKKRLPGGTGVLVHAFLNLIVVGA